MSDADAWEEPTPNELKQIDEAKRMLTSFGYKVVRDGSKTVITGDPDFDEILDKCCEILGVKGADYTIGNKDRLHNFRTVGNFCDLSPMQALGVYFYKHVSAIFAFIKNGGQSESEPIDGRIADVINYMLLFYKMVKEQKNGKSNGKTVLKG